MRRRCASITAGIVALALLSSLAAAPAIRAAPSRQLDLCYRIFLDLEGSTSCFPPSQEAVAERRMKVRPIRPNQAVWQAVHMRLRFIALLSFRGAPQMNYFYGRPDGAGNPNSIAPGFDYVLVRESSGHLAQSRMTFYGTMTGGPWRLQVNARNRRLVLEVESTRGRQVERRIALALLTARGPS